MNALVIDTSAWIDYLGGQHSGEIDVALREGRVYLSPIVAAELLSGFKPESKRELFREFIKELPLCSCDLEHWIRVGELRRRLQGKGLSTTVPDIHVAQCALDLDCYLLTRDKIFRKIQAAVGLKMIERW